MGNSDKNILVLGVEEVIVHFLKKEMSDCNLNILPYDQKYFEDILSPEPAAIVCSHPTTELRTIEVAQSLRMIYSAIPIYFVSTIRDKFNRKDLQKNGFTEAFLLPADNYIFVETIRRVLSENGQIKSFRNVKLIDIPSDNALGFDMYVHLQANNKYIKFVSASEALSADKSARLHKHHMETVAVPEDQVKKFYEFTALQLKKLNSSSSMSETEKQELRETTVRNLFSGIFGDAGKDDNLTSGRSVMSDCQEIIKAYIINESDAPMRWLDRLAGSTGESGTTYNHATNTATYAALFSLGLAVGKPDEIALAGLLHDIGLAEMPIELAMKNLEDYTPAEFEIYKKHPQNSVNLIKEKKLIVSEKVMKIILQHHERYDGLGFPQAMPGPRILREAQILAIADLFDELTKIVPGQVRLSPQAAIEKILDMNSKNKNEVYFDPSLLRQIVGLFHADEKAA